jgi:predicted mannosyl-3-phosphoglycerate phosphatase (HAD superfamily)
MRVGDGENEIPLNHVGMLATSIRSLKPKSAEALH